MNYIIHLLDPKTFISRLPELDEIYGKAFSGPPYNKPAWELNSFAGEAREHLARSGFRACAAVQISTSTTGCLVGFTYGYQLRPEYWWSRQVQPHLARLGLETWLQDAFELTQMAVLPGFHGRGIGGKLHDLLLKELPYCRGLLSTLYGDTNATALYRKRGWQTLLGPFYFPGITRPYRIMGLALTPLDGNRSNFQMTIPLS